jgi:hypothetical protein
MVPTSLIMVILVAAFFPASFGYFHRSPWLQHRLVNVEFLVLGSVGTLMLLTIILAIAQVTVAWLSWVLLVTAIILLATSIPVFRAAVAHVRARERAVAEARARGH